MSDQQLMSYFKFDETDVQANRNGQFTEKQKADLLEDQKYSKLFSMIGGAFLVVLAVGGVVLAISLRGSNPGRGLFTSFGLSVGCVLPLIFGALGARTLLRAFKKFDVTIQKAEGPANLVSRPFKLGDPNLIYELHVGGRIFRVGSDLGSIVKQGDVYALYYTEGSENNLLSAERISGAK